MSREDPRIAVIDVHLQAITREMQNLQQDLMKVRLLIEDRKGVIPQEKAFQAKILSHMLDALLTNNLAHCSALYRLNEAKSHWDTLKPRLR
jgi:hypothetical protein